MPTIMWITVGLVVWYMFGYAYLRVNTNTDEQHDDLIMEMINLTTFMPIMNVLIIIISLSLLCSIMFYFNNTIDAIVSILAVVLSWMNCYKILAQ